MRHLCFLFPHLKMDIGGNLAQAKLLRACGTFTSAEAVTYGERVEGYRHLDDVLTANPNSEVPPIFIVHWGPDVSRLLDRLSGRDTVYVAHSTGWHIALPPTVPILCVSRNTQGYWGRHAPNSLIRYVPNVISFENCTTALDVERDIDVLVQRRKSSAYLMDNLVPALSDKCNLVVLDGWVDDLTAYFRRSKIYLYDSVDHWITMRATEGFGLPPLEAMACGCIIFSSINDALSDFLDPGINCRKVRVHSTEYDVHAILRALREREPRPADRAFLKPFTEQDVAARLCHAFEEIGEFFQLTHAKPSNIPDPWKGHRSPSLRSLPKRALRSLRPGA